MLKIILHSVLKVVWLFVLALILNWLYGVFNHSSYFIFFVICMFAYAIDRTSRDLKFVKDEHYRLREQHDKLAEELHAVRMHLKYGDKLE